MRLYQPEYILDLTARHQTGSVDSQEITWSVKYTVYSMINFIYIINLYSCHLQRIPQLSLKYHMVDCLYGIIHSWSGSRDLTLFTSQQGDPVLPAYSKNNILYIIRSNFLIFSVKVLFEILKQTDLPQLDLPKFISVQNVNTIRYVNDTIAKPERKLQNSLRKQAKEREKKGLLRSLNIQSSITCDELGISGSSRNRN